MCRIKKKPHSTGFLVIALFLFAGLPKFASAQSPSWSDRGVLQHGVSYDLKLYAQSGQWSLVGLGRSSSGSCSLQFSRRLSGNVSFTESRNCGAVKVTAHFNISGWRGTSESISFALAVDGKAAESTGVADLFGKLTKSDTSLGRISKYWTISGTDSVAVKRRKQAQQGLATQQAEQRRIQEQQRLATQQAEQRRIQDQQRLATQQAEQRRIQDQQRLATQQAEQRRIQDQQRLATQQAEQRRIDAQQASNSSDALSTSSATNRSLVNNVGITSTFVNQVRGPVDIYWVNFKGEEVIYQRDLESGAAWRVDTYATHVWRFRQQGKLLAEHVVAVGANPVYEIFARQVTTSAPIQYLVAAGGGTGRPFNDQCTDVTHVVVRSGWWIDGVQVVCRGPSGSNFSLPHRGGLGGYQSVFTLQPNEHILGIVGTTHGSSGPYVYSIQFLTNLRVSEVFGNGGDDRGQRGFRSEIPNGLRFAGLHGSAGNFLTSIGLTMQ